MNNVMLIGRLVRDPELRYTQGTNTAVCRITLAVDRPTKEKETDFINVKLFGRQAETTGQYMSKGRQVAIQGSIQTGSYTKQDGTKVYTTDVIADRIEFLGKEDRREEPQEDRFQPRDDRRGFFPPTDAPRKFEYIQEEIPF